jgi:hypothetical protein
LGNGVCPKPDKSSACLLGIVTLKIEDESTPTPEEAKDKNPKKTKIE